MKRRVLRRYYELENSGVTSTLNSMKKFAIPLILILVAAAGYFAYRAFSGPAAAPRLADLPPAQRAERRADAEQLIRKVDEVARAARKNEKSNFSVTATQEQLNTLLQDKIKIKNSPVSDLSAALQPDSLILSGRAKYNGLEVPVVINGNLSAQNGGLSLEIQSLTLGGFGAPSDWKNKAQKAASDAIEKALSGGEKVRFESVQIEREKLTVTGQTG